MTYKILFLSTYEWSDLWRRRQRLADEWSRQPEVASVLYVNPPVATSVLDLVRGRFEPGHLGSERSAQLDAIAGRPRRVGKKAWTYTGSEKTLPLTRLGAVRALQPLGWFNRAAYVERLRSCLRRLPGERLIVYLSHPLHTFALEAFPGRALACFDWTDDWMHFEQLPLADRDAYARLCERAPRDVDLVFAVSRTLYQRAATLNESAYWLPNATSFPTIGADEVVVDDPIAAIPGPRLGYVGQIGDRIDFELLRQVAEARPDWSIVMIGPVWENRRDEAERVGKLSNVHFVGPRPYAALPSLFALFDVCLIPHTVDELTASMDPIKLYDYLGTTKPIVTTPVAGVERFADAIYVADSAEAYVGRIAQALAERDGSLAEKRRRYAAMNTWEARAGEAWKAIQDRIGAGPPRGLPEASEKRVAGMKETRS